MHRIERISGVALRRSMLQRAPCECVAAALGPWMRVLCLAKMVRAPRGPPVVGTTVKFAPCILVEMHALFPHLYVLCHEGTRPAQELHVCVYIYMIEFGTFCVDWPSRVSRKRSLRPPLHSWRAFQPSRFASKKVQETFLRVGFVGLVFSTWLWLK